MKKPINIAFELLLIIVIMFSWLLNIFENFDDTWILAALLITYLIGVISITMRTRINKKEDQRFVSVYMFGLFNGVCFGGLLFLLDTHTLNVGSHILLIGVILWGIAGGFIATLISYFLSMKFFRDILKILDLLKEKHN